MEESFQDGCSEIEKALKDKGVNPKSNSPEDLAAAISEVKPKFSVKTVENNYVYGGTNTITFNTGITGKIFEQTIFAMITKGPTLGYDLVNYSYNSSTGVVTVTQPNSEETFDPNNWYNGSANYVLTVYYTD